MKVHKMLCVDTWIADQLRWEGINCSELVNRLLTEYLERQRNKIKDPRIAELRKELKEREDKIIKENSTISIPTGHK